MGVCLVVTTQLWSDVEIPCHSIACSNAAMQAAKDEGRGLSGAQIPTGNIFRYL